MADPKLSDEDLHDEDIEDEVEGQEDGAGEGGQDDDAAELAVEETDDEGERPEAVAKPSRAESRFQKLANEAREAREEAAKLRKELEEDRRQRAALAAQTQEKEPSPEEMALWTPDQIIDYKLGKASKNFDQRLSQLQWNTYETNDKATFNSLCATDPRAKRYADEVEERLKSIRAQGQNVDRVALLKFVIGEKVFSKSGQAVSKQKQAGAERVRRQQTNPPGGQGDVRGGRGKDDERTARMKRLENVVF